MPLPTLTKYVYDTDWVVLEVKLADEIAAGRAPANATKIRVHNLTTWWRVGAHPTLKIANAILKIVKSNGALPSPAANTVLWSRGQSTKVATGVDDGLTNVTFDGWVQNFPGGMVFGPDSVPAVTDGIIRFLLDARAVNGSRAAMETDINVTLSFE